MQPDEHAGLAPLPASAPDDARARHYDAVIARLCALLDGEDDWIAALSTTACELHHAFEAFHWTGFYRRVGPALLVVGPYQGGHGCLRIPFDRGVCGAAARTRTTQLVPDVEAFPGHIACSATTRSEIVVPVFAGGDAAGELVAVLDVDSDLPAAFGPVDQDALERVAALLGRLHPAPPIAAPRPAGRPGASTLAVHAGRPEPAWAGAVATPIFQTSTFHDGGGDGYDEVRYTRLNNGPNHLVLGAKLAALAGAEAAVVTASGMAAITTSLLANLGAGERVLMQRGVYGGTHMLAADLARWGVHVDLAPGDDPTTWDAAITPQTRVVYVEAISNPLVKVLDLTAVVALARRHGLVAIVDATFATPVLLRPAELGFDLELHSATKYLNGHSDLIAGAVIGRADALAPVRRLLGHTGACLDPHACALLERGMKTLPLRVRRQSDNALTLARALAARADVLAVHHPGLDEAARVPAAVRHAFAGYGGVLAFDVGDGARAERLLGALELALHAPSLGGVETLVTRPVATSHRGLTPDERRALGIGDGLVRVALGIEDADDLVADFIRALDRSAA